MKHIRLFDLSQVRVVHLFLSIRKQKEPNTKALGDLLFGMGKIGRNTCENLVKHIQNDHIVLINRTRERAEKMAGKFKLIVKDYADLPVEIRKADIIIVATGAEKPTLSKSLIHTENPLLVLDLSIPKNVDDNVLDLPNVTRIHIDELSKITDSTLAERQKEVPKAEKIMAEVIDEFNDWLQTRAFAPTVQALKQMMEKLEQQALAQQQKKHPESPKIDTRSGKAQKGIFQ